MFPDCDIKKIKGQDNLYRIRVGNYRIFFVMEMIVFNYLPLV